MSSSFQDRVISDIMILLMMLSMATYANAEEGEDLYLKSGIHDIPIYSRSISTPPVLIHRRNDFFLKAGKSVPRIGRRNYEYVLDPSYTTETTYPQHHVDRRNDFFFKAHHKQIPRIGRRNEMASTDVNTHQLEPKLTKKDDTVTSQMDQEGVLAAWPWFRNPEMFSPYQKRQYLQQNDSDDATDLYEIN